MTDLFLFPFRELTWTPPVILQTSTSAPSRASARTGTVWTHWAASSAPAKPVWCWRGTAAWVCTTSVPAPPPLHPPPPSTRPTSSLFPQLLNRNLTSSPRLTPSFSDPDPESPPEYGQCFRMVTNARGCELPLLGNLTQEMCCCTVGKAWGRNCERCPLQGTGECSAAGQQQRRAERRCQLTTHCCYFKVVAYPLLLKESPLDDGKVVWTNHPGVHKNT